MAAGKSTVGPLLADRLGWTFVDFDQVIREDTGCTAGQLIRERGEGAFRELEAQVTGQFSAAEHVVLAPGGGWITRPDLIERLERSTASVWLRVTVDEALRRAESDPADRPLLGSLEGRRERVAALLQQREPFYERADVVVDVDGREPSHVVEEILRRLGSDREGDER